MTISAVVLDIGGVLLDGSEPLPGAVTSVARLQQAGVPFVLLTNTTRTSRDGLLVKLRQVGISISAEQLLTPTIMARSWLESHAKQPMLLIHAGLQADFPGLGESNLKAGAVVVGDAGDDFSYEALNQAFRLLMNGAVLLSLSGSRYFRESGELFLDAGPFVRLLEQAAGVQALEMGKPGRLFFQHAVEQLGVEPDEVLMVGDDVVSDIGGACAAGLQGVLVQTGKYHPGDEARLPKGARLVRDVTEAVDFALS
jgi:HAD superfamily hydrolase (TIGR01458 family)